MEKNLFFIFVILLCSLPRNIVTRVSTSKFINDPNDNKIVGGYNATIQQFPYQAFLLISQGVQLFQCGGSIISAYYILTAAHCIQQATLIIARVGSTFADRGGKEYTSLFFMNHPFYNPTIIDYDVAFVRTLRRMAIDGTNTRVISLAPSGSAVAPGTILTVSGWGATTESGSVVNNLRAVNVPVISSAECKKAYKTLTPRMVCAGVQEGGKDSCGGDSGGPAVTGDGIQRGIVSYGVGCARPDYPGVYTNVSSVRSWIRLMTGV